MTTTPPTETDLDTHLSGQFFPHNGFVYQFENGNGVGPYTYFYVAYTQNDTTPVYQNLGGDPAVDVSIRQTLDGLIAEYGSVLLRKYTYTFSVPSLTIGDVTADSGTQSDLNDSANWVAVP